MFKATFKDFVLFRDSLQAISELIREGVFDLKKEGIFFKATDPTMVTLVDFKYLVTNFENYDLKQDTEIGINLDMLLSILKRAKANDKVLFQIEEGENKLDIIMEGNSKREFHIPLIDIDKGDVPNMNLDFEATIEIKTGVFSEGIADASVITDTLKLRAEKEGKFIIEAKGTLSSSKLELDKKSKDLIGIKVNETVESKFTLEYLKKIDKASKLTNSLKIQLGQDYPAEFIYSIKDSFELSYILAPRAED